MHDRAIAFPLAALLSLASTHSVPAQAVLETPTRRIEFIGLKRWTIPMIRDSLARYAPGDSLTGHACAVVLRQSLKFADASVISSNRPDSAGREQTVITVIEPQDSALVRYRREAADSLAIESHYAAAIKAFKAHPREFQRAIQDSAFLLARRMPAAAAEVAWRLPLEPVRRMLVTEATPRGRARALRVLARDRNPFNRSIAILVVSTAPGVDSTWWTLADELRYPNGFAAGTAEMALKSLAYYAPRRVNWAPVRDPLEALVGGTNLFARSTIMMVLARTEIASDLGLALVRRGAPLILATLRASTDASMERDATREFVERVSGLHYGLDDVAWGRWVNQVASGSE